MNAILKIFPFVVLLAGCGASNVSMVPPPETMQKKVAVLNFKGADDDMRHMIRDEVTTILPAKGYTLIERAELEQVIGEQKQPADGFVDINQAVKIGRLVGADVVLIGSLQNYKEDVTLYSADISGTVYGRAVDVESGKVIWTHKSAVAARKGSFFGLVGASSFAPVREEFATRVGKDITATWPGRK